MEFHVECERQVYSVDEVAAKLGVNIKTAYESIAAGEIPSMRIGRRILIPRAAFDAMVGRGRKAA